MKCEVRSMKKQFQQSYQKIKAYFLSDTRTFAKGLCFDKLFFIFLVGCVVGTYYEQILNLVKYYLNDGTIFWESRRGVIYGPFNPLYGFGAVVMTICLMKKERPWYLTLFYGFMLGGIIEYGVSWFQEIFVGTTSWNYTGYFLNIGGRTTITFMFAWGIMGLLFVYVAYPFLSQLIERIPYLLGKWLTRFFVVFMCLDMIISWTALVRQTFRRMGREPITFVGEVYDKIYTDEFLEQYFPNMKPSNRTKK